MRINANGKYTCADHPDFTPNVSPKEIFQKGAFGGTYFRDIQIQNKWYRNAWREFEPHGWFQSLDVPEQVACNDYVNERNRYKVKCGQSLTVWVDKGWIDTNYDSHGWVHWYCRFFLGRRCKDDTRQISRWKACAGEKGRWKRNLIAKCVRAKKPFDDESVSPTVRQLLLHWAYELTEHDYDHYKKMLEQGQKTSFVPQSQMKGVVIKESTDESANDNRISKSRKRQQKNQTIEQSREKRSRNS